MDRIYNDDIEARGEINGDVIFKNLDFTEKTIRQGFIRKVYGILMVQLLISLGLVSVFMYIEPVKLFVYENGVPFVLSALVILIVTVVTMFCSTDLRRKSPHNFIFLGIFTLAMSFLLGVMTSACQKDEIYFALGICTVITVGLTLFAFQTKIDFTMFHGTLYALFMTLFVVGISAWFLTYDRVTQIAIAGIGAFIYSLLLIFDTQLIIGGKHKLEISPEEYVFASLTLYLDIISIFIRILRIMRLV